MRSKLAEQLSLEKRIHRYLEAFHYSPPRYEIEGRLTQIIGLTLEAEGLVAVLGARCHLYNQYGEIIKAEVVGFSGDKTFLMPINSVRGLAPGAKIKVLSHATEVAVGDQLLGRVINGAGQPLDQNGPIVTQNHWPLSGRPINPLERAPINSVMDIGVQAINALLPIGRGQRMGLFAGSGVGKSVLLGMMTQLSQVDVIVVGLVGERGREVKEFIEHHLGEDGMKRSVVVAVPADQPPLMRLHGAMWATSIAEYFRDEGADVLLLVDSITRFSYAQRELALAIGEPPATRGYPPSVFAKLPQLIERAGHGEVGKGSITAIYTVLVEGDDLQDPIADSARAILDGHIVLSRELAEQGHYPAIDIERSVSRTVSLTATEEHQENIMKFRRIYSKFQQNKDLINVGAYAPGSDLELDHAILHIPKMLNFLQQKSHQVLNYSDSLAHLNQLLNESTGTV